MKKTVAIVLLALLTVLTLTTCSRTKDISGTWISEEHELYGMMHIAYDSYRFSGKSYVALTVIKQYYDYTKGNGDITELYLNKGRGGPSYDPHRWDNPVESMDSAQFEKEEKGHDDNGNYYLIRVSPTTDFSDNESFRQTAVKGSFSLTANEIEFDRSDGTIFVQPFSYTENTITIDGIRYTRQS